MSWKSAHFCDAKDCKSYMTGDPATCPLCKREFCGSHEGQLGAALTLSYFRGMEGNTHFLSLCTECVNTYKSILKDARTKVVHAVQTLEQATMEELKLAHTAKALKE